VRFPDGLLKGEKKVKKIITYTMVLLALGTSIVSAEVYEFGFNALQEEPDVTNAVPTNIVEAAHSVGETQIRMFVDIDEGLGNASFSFYNLGATTSTLGQIFIDEGSFDLTYVSKIQSTGVDYDVQSAPINPPVAGPSSTEAGWTWDTSLLADPNPPPAATGINNYDGDIADAEVLTLLMTYAPGANLLDALKYGDVRVATKLASLEFDGTMVDVSEFFVHGGQVIPEPASVALLVGAGSLIGIIRRRFIG
jgi:hypothetical protein